MSEFESQTPIREGLPPTYRMRADAHYVDLIESRAMQVQKAVAPVASPHEPALDPTLHAGHDLARSLTTLANCAVLLSDTSSDLSRAVVGDLIRAEAWRASSLLHATRVVRRELPIARTAISVSSVLDKVTLGFQPERRVRAITFEARSALPYGSVVVGDEQMLTGAISWALLSSLAVLNGIEGARLTLSAGADPSAGISFAVSQPIVTPPAMWHARAFDPTWTDRPGGVAALVWMLALQETVHVHGGTIHVERSEPGTTIGFILPATT